jgi:sulfite exporter TauE/SafE
MHTIVTYIIRIGLGAIGLTAERAVSIARRLAWIIIEIVLILAFLYAVAFIAASVGMLVVEQPVEYRIDTIQTNQSKLQTIKQLNSK